MGVAPVEAVADHGDAVVEALTAFTTSAALDVSDAARHEATRRLVDSVGAALGGVDEPAPNAVRSYLAGRERQDGVRIWGTSRRADPEAASLANGAALRCLDRNDTYLGREVVHPSDLIAGVCAIAERQQASGTQLLEAIVVGYEVLLALCDLTPLRTYGWDHVNFTALGACCGAARVAGLTPGQTRQALALTVVPHVALRQTRTGQLSMWKALAGPDAVRHALQAVLMAAAGVEGPRRPFTGDMGFLVQLFGTDVTAGDVADGVHLPTRPERILAAHMKSWPVGHVAQTAVDAARDLRAQGVTLPDVERLRLTTFRSAADLVISDDKLRPDSPETADHSLPYVVLAMLRDGYLDERSYRREAYADPRVRAVLQDRLEIDIRDDAAAGYPGAMPCTLEATLTDGRTVTSHADHHRGHPSNPMSDRDLVDKFTALATACLPADRLPPLLDALWGVADRRDVGEVFALLAR